jgi:hypothetical protein
MKKQGRKKASWVEKTNQSGMMCSDSEVIPDIVSFSSHSLFPPGMEKSVEHLLVEVLSSLRLDTFSAGDQTVIGLRILKSGIPKGLADRLDPFYPDNTYAEIDSIRI